MGGRERRECRCEGVERKRIKKKKEGMIGGFLFCKVGNG